MPKGALKALRDAQAEDLEDDRRHLANPADRRKVLVHVAQDERIGDDRLRAALLSLGMGISEEKAKS